MKKTMKAIMNTTKRNIMTIVMVAALALPAIAVEYGNTSSFGAGPQASFQSTSTMVGSGSMYASCPSLNDNGTATTPYASSSGRPYKAPPLIVNPGQLEEGHVPLGDEVLPLMLLAMMYAAWIAIKRRRKANS